MNKVFVTIDIRKERLNLIYSCKNYEGKNDSLRKQKSDYSMDFFHPQLLMDVVGAEGHCNLL